VTAGNRSEQTSARMRTCDPTWEQALVFLICNPESDDLYLKVKLDNTILAKLFWILNLNSLDR
jgi:hypothetical protein